MLILTVVVAIAGWLACFDQTIRVARYDDDVDIHG